MKEKTVLCTVPGMDDVRVERDVPYTGELTMDVYRPGDGSPRAAVVIVAGYPDAGFQRIVGCRFKEMGSSTSWARLIAASRLMAITYTNRDPVADVQTLLQHVRQSLGIEDIGLWASSGNVPLALWLVLQRAVKRAALCYGYTFDVPDAARAFGFVNPADGKSVDDLPGDVPLFIARAGHDETPGLKETLDRFVAAAIAHILPVTFANHPEGPHAFDLLDDSATTRAIVRRVLTFLRSEG